jgi:protein TIF31
MQIDRNVTKTYNDFMEASRQGAIAIVDGKLQALNPNEPKRTHVYVYNSIFFSFAIDCPTSYPDLTSKENNPSFTQSNHDLTGLRLLQGLDI